VWARLAAIPFHLNQHLARKPDLWSLIPIASSLLFQLMYSWMKGSWELTSSFVVPSKTRRPWWSMRKAGVGIGLVRGRAPSDCLRVEQCIASTKGVLEAMRDHDGAGVGDVALLQTASMMVVEVMGSRPPVGES